MKNFREFVRMSVAVVLVAITMECVGQTPQETVRQARLALERHVAGAVLDQSETAFGDVNGDGFVDFATLVADRTSDDNVRITVFLGASDGAFRFHDMSSKIARNPRATLGLTIERNSLFLNRDGSDGCCSHSVETWQFSFRQGKLMMIGLESGSAHPQGSVESDYKLSVNLLTARVERWNGSARKKMRVAGLKPVPLREFDFEQFNQQWGKVFWS